MKKFILSIDVGPLKSGVSIISNELIHSAYNLENDDLFRLIEKYKSVPDLIVCIEDIRAYSCHLSMQVVDTCKFIGELTYRLRKEYCVDYVLITRVDVKKWIFDTNKKLCSDRIIKKLEYLDVYNTSKGLRGKRRKDGKLIEPSFNYVDDRIVIAAIKKLWNISTPKPGKSNEYGLSAHSWQALAVGSYYLKVLRIPLEC